MSKTYKMKLKPGIRNGLLRAACAVDTDVLYTDKEGRDYLLAHNRAVILPVKKRLHS